MIRGAIGTDPSSCTSNRDGNASENTRLGRDNGARRPQDPFKIAEPSMTIYRPTMTRKRSPPPLIYRSRFGFLGADLLSR